MLFERIHQLKSKGYVPDTIFDIGAYHGHWTHDMLHIYPDATFFLYEAIEYHELSSRDFQTAKVRVFSNTLLHETETDVVWYQKKNTGDSMFRENSWVFKDCEKIVRSTTTLDQHCADHHLEVERMGSIFLKVDTQGSEIPILKGGSAIAKKADFILLEVPFFGQYNTGVPSFREHIEFMESIGFVPYDILENHYVCEFNIQVDILFIRKDHPLVDSVKKRLLGES